VCPTGDTLSQGVADEDLELENQSEEGMTPTRRTYAPHHVVRPAVNVLHQAWHRPTASARCAPSTGLKRCAGLVCSHIL